VTIYRINGWFEVVDTIKNDDIFLFTHFESEVKQFIPFFLQWQNSFYGCPLKYHVIDSNKE
jgi:hypothetical protein